MPEVPTTSPAPLGRRERRKAETRQRLLDAASQLFAKQGFEATRPQDIARAADVAIGTFYLHFSDRRSAFLAFTAQAAEELMERMRDRHSESASFEDGLAQYLDALLDYTEEKPGVLRAAFADERVIAMGTGDADEGSLRDRLARTFARGLEQGMASGVIASDYDPLLLSYALVGMIQHALSHGAQRQLDRDVVIDNITRFCAGGLRGTGPLPPTPRHSNQASKSSTQEIQGMTQLVYTEEELFRSHDYAKEHNVAGHHLHGGFDADGSYVSPRALIRDPAFDAWIQALRGRGGDLLDADASLLGGARNPSAAQQKLLLQEGLGQTFWNNLTITGMIEGRGRMLAEVPFPNLQDIIVEDISEMAIGHIQKGLLVAHGIDEGGEPDKGVGGHDVMWFALRDLAFGQTDYAEPVIPDRIGRPESEKQESPEIPPAHEGMIMFLLNLLIIEFRAELGFSMTEQMLRDPELFPERREQAEEAADVVNRIRIDEEIHVKSLRLYLGELRNVTLKTASGTMPGSELIDAAWKRMKHWATVEAPKLQAAESQKLMTERILKAPDGERILAAYNALASS